MSAWSEEAPDELVCKILKRIERIRTQQKVSMKALSIAATQGKNKSYYSALIKRQSEPGVVKLIGIAEALSVSPLVFLLDREDVETLTDLFERVSDFDGENLEKILRVAEVFGDPKAPTQSTRSMQPSLVER